jgi:thiamine biosynthesis lipoprotein
VGGPGGLAEGARRRVDDLERRWSRFDDDSEINALNRAAGSWLEVSADTVTLVQRAGQAWRLSGGAFDPTVLGAVIRAGYDGSFDRLGPAPGPGRSALLTGAAGIAVDGCRVRLEAGTGFDPGGIGKGLAADLVCAETLAGGAEGVCVNLGGDVRVVGTGPDGGGWTVAVEHPWASAPVALVGLADGAVATSTTLLRRWEGAAGARHHLIDPRTGEPSDSDVRLACVVAAEGWVAEVLAKAVLLAGAAHPFDIVGGTGADALAVDDCGRVAATEGFARFLDGTALPAALAGAPAGRVP